MANIVRRSASISPLNSEVDNFYGTLRNIGAAADNTAAVAASTAAIERATTATVQNTALMVYEQIDTNIKLDQSLKLQGLQLHLAVKANEELRSIDSTVQALGKTVIEIGNDLKEIGKESNALLKASLGVQTDLLNAIRSEHARLEQDRKAKRLIYELEQVLDKIKAEPALVRAYAAGLMLHRTGAANFSVDEIFEVTDKRQLDGLRAQMRTLIESAGDEAQAELAKFEETCRLYFRTLAEDLERDLPAEKKPIPLFSEVADNEGILPPCAGERPMNAALARELSFILMCLHDKQKRLQCFNLVVGGIGGVFILISLILTFIIPIPGLLMLIAFTTCLFIMLGTPLARQTVELITQIAMNPTEERNFLAEIGTTEKGASEALAAWAEYLNDSKALKEGIAREAAIVRKRNEQVRRSNVAIKTWNQHRSELLAAVRTHHDRNLANLLKGLEAFLAKYPSLNKWWSWPEQQAV